MRKITIERHSPVDGVYFLISENGALFAKTYRLIDAERIFNAVFGTNEYEFIGY